MFRPLGCCCPTLATLPKEIVLFFPPFYMNCSCRFSFVSGRSFKVFSFVLCLRVLFIMSVHCTPLLVAQRMCETSVFSFCVSRRLVCRLLLTCLFIVVMKSFWLVEELCGFYLLLPDRDRNKFTLAATLQMLVKRQNECLQGLHTTSGAGYCQSVSDVCEEELLFLFLFVCGKVLRPKGSEEIHSHFNWWVLC